MAKGYFSINWDDPAVLDIRIGKGVPYLYLDEALGDEYGDNWEREIILAPFLNVVSLNMSKYKGREIEKAGGWSYQRYYYVHFEKQELPEISEAEEEKLERDLVETANEQYENIIEALEFNLKYEELYRRETMIRRELSDMLNIYRKKTKQYLANDEHDKLAKLKKYQSDEKVYLEEELEKIRIEKQNLSDRKQELLVKIQEWKAKMRTLCMSRCRRREIEIDRQVQEEENIFQEEYKKEQENRRREYEQKSRDEAESNISEMKFQSEKMTQITRKSN